MIDKEDPFRHSKWLSFMAKRLELAHQLLATDGVAIVHIDEHEVDNLYQLMTQIFGEDNDLGRIIWDKRNPKGDSRGISILNESILCFAKNKESFLSLAGVMRRNKTNAEQMISKSRQLMSRIGKVLIPDDIKIAIRAFSYPDSVMEQLSIQYDLTLVRKEYKAWLANQNFSGGELAYRHLDDDGRIYRTVSMAWPNNKKAPDDYFTPLIHPVTKKPCPVPAKGWRNPSSTMKKLLRDDLIVFGDDETKQPERKYFLDENMQENIPSIISYGGSDDKLFKKLDLEFDNPKPVDIASYLLKNIYGSAVTILDFFAGSGTAGHATLEMNRLDGGVRQFILCTNNENGIAENITYKRIEKVIDGYADVEGTPANVRYFKTDFVSKQKTDDQTRLAIVDRCTDMIRIRENTFEEVVNEQDFKIYKDSDHYTAIIFDPLNIADYIKKIEEIDTTKPVSLYIFSYSSYTYSDDIPETPLEYTTCSIPESVLEVYQRIFRKESSDV